MGFTSSKGVYHPFYATIPLPLHNWRECDANGDVANIVGNGGVLASDTTPIMRGDANHSQEIAWAASNSDPIVCQVPLPDNFDPDEDMLVDFEVLSGTTDAASLGLESSFNGAAGVSDTATDSAKSATAHTVTAVVSAADIPDAATRVTLIVTPPAHTTDGISLLNARIRYVPKQF